MKASFLVGLASILAAAHVGLAATETVVASPDSAVQFRLLLREGRLSFTVTSKTHTIIERSPMQFTVDGVDLTESVEAGPIQRYQVNETYTWLGAHAVATNHCNGATLSLEHRKSHIRYSLEVRAFDDAIVFRFIVAGGNSPRVPDEATSFSIPPGSTVWVHDLQGHYEGVHVKKDIAGIKDGEWAAPPLTFKLANGAGYAAITEAALVNYSGMALQADGQRGFRVRLGHSHPPSYPFKLRYPAEDIERLSQPAAITGTITTPWRVVMLGPDLNTLVNCDVVHNLCPPPDPKFFPKGANTDWVKPGRAV